MASLTACQNVQLALATDPEATRRGSRKKALELLSLVELGEHAENCRANSQAVKSSASPSRVPWCGRQKSYWPTSPHLLWMGIPDAPLSTCCSTWRVSFIARCCW